MLNQVDKDKNLEELGRKLEKMIDTEDFQVQEGGNNQFEIIDNTVKNLQKIDKYDYDNGGAKLSNMLFGLFDGYLYDEIYTYAYEHLPEQMYDELEQRLNKVHLSLAA